MDYDDIWLALFLAFIVGLHHLLRNKFGIFNKLDVVKSPYYHINLQPDSGYCLELYGDSGALSQSEAHITDELYLVVSMPTAAHSGTKFNIINVATEKEYLLKLYSTEQNIKFIDAVNNQIRAQNALMQGEPLGKIVDGHNSHITFTLPPQTSA